MDWPQSSNWLALQDGASARQWNQSVPISVIDCGELLVPTGRLVVADPFIFLRPSGNKIVSIPPGRYPVKVTLADVSKEGDGSHIREAYATLLLKESEEVERRIINLPQENDDVGTLGPGEYIGFGVDTATACFVDEGALAPGMPAESTWDEAIFENNSPDCWINRMDDPSHIRKGIANVALPLATDGSNAILIHTGWGDGVFPVIGGYDAAGQLTRIHIDFFVIHPGDMEDEN